MISPEKFKIKINLRIQKISLFCHGNAQDQVHLWVNLYVLVFVEIMLWAIFWLEYIKK